MNYSLFELRQSQEVIELFINVFTDSEGQDEGKSIGKLVTELITTSASDLFGFVATDNEKIIGCIFFSRLILQNNVNAFILSPVAVNTINQGKGIGQQLIRFGIHHLKEQGVELVFTYGDPDYYKKLGFVLIREKSIKAPFKLTHPEGWLGQSLTGDKITIVSGTSHCVEALNKQEYW